MKEHSLISVTLKTAVVHTVTYFIVGIAAFILLDYTSKFAHPAIAPLMRPANDPLVAAGTLFQIVRGLLFGLVFFALRDVVFVHRNGWLVLWLTLVVFGILSPFGAAPSSIEGMVYTRLPMWFHLMGLPEVVIQAFLLALLSFYWINHPEKKWLGWIFAPLFILAALMSTMGFIAAVGRL